MPNRYVSNNGEVCFELSDTAGQLTCRAMVRAQAIALRYIIDSVGPPELVKLGIEINDA